MYEGNKGHYFLWQLLVTFSYLIIYHMNISIQPTTHRYAIAVAADDMRYLSNTITILYNTRYKGSPGSIQPFWISWEPVMWTLCNLSASQRRPYCASVNSHSPMGLVRQQWDATDWACVLCDYRIHNDQASRSASSWQCACPFYSSSAGFFGKESHHPGLSAPHNPDLASCDFWLFPKLKSPLKGTRFVNATVTMYTSSVNGVSLPTN